MAQCGISALYLEQGAEGKEYAIEVNGHIDQYDDNGEHQIHHRIPQNDIEIFLVHHP